MTVTAAIRRMLGSGLTIEQALDAAEAFEQEMAQPQLSKRQARNKRYYEGRKASESVLNTSKASYSDVSDTSPNGLEGSPTPLPKTLNPISSTSSLRSEDARARVRDTRFEFDQEFWPAYPHKVGKPDALKAFLRARNRAQLDTIMDGLRAYVGKSDDRPWCNPSTWLNQDRWGDQPALFNGHSQARAPPAPDFADFFMAEARKAKEEEDGRTIDHSDESREAGFARPALPRPSTPKG
jgi:hypothetical protein